MGPRPMPEQAPLVDTLPPTAETLLLVDDEAQSLRILSETLAGEGLRLLIARSGAEALVIAAREAPALVLLDIMMPGMNGFEVCERLMQDPGTRDSAVIFLSGLDDIEDKVRGLRLGAVDYITKPFDVGAEGGAGAGRTGRADRYPGVDCR